MQGLAANFRRVWRHRDFRLMWIGAMLSFVGSWVQNVAQGILVYQLTKSEALLGLVTFCGSAPVAILAPVAGTLSDIFNKKKLLVVCQIIFAAGSLFLAAGTYGGWIRYEHVIAVALIGGLTSSFEMPARQTTISSVVPAEDLAAAIPINAMTFNSARLVGPAIGAILVKIGGPALCYLVDGISYSTLIFAASALSANFAPVKRVEPIKDLLFEGMLYTMRDSRLKMLFLLESGTAAFGLIYLTQLPVFTKENLGLDNLGYSLSMSFIGVGALIALLVNIAKSDVPNKAPQIVGSMGIIGSCLCVLGFQHNAFVAVPLMAVIGGATIIQFNTTNALFQQIAPPRLRGRVLAMHVWALSGIGPFGTLALSNLAEHTKHSGNPISGLTLSYLVGGSIITVVSLIGWTKSAKLQQITI